MSRLRTKPFNRSCNLQSENLAVGKEEYPQIPPITQIKSLDLQALCFCALYFGALFSVALVSENEQRTKYKALSSKLLICVTNQQLLVFLARNLKTAAKR